MAQASPFKPIALVVEDDAMQRELAAMLLEDCEMGVVQCESAEAALKVLVRLGPSVSMMLTDVNLAGKIDGLELAQFTHENYPNIHVVVTSGLALKRSLPEDATFMPKPWVARDLMREAERSYH